MGLFSINFWCMYSNGMAVTLQSFELRNCSFQRMIRGFVRVQGTNRKNFEKFIVENCLFYNCGYYDNAGSGYACTPLLIHYILQNQSIVLPV